MPMIKAIRWFCSLVSYVLLSFNLFGFLAARDTLRAGESLIKNETLTSASGVFELGFFSIDGPSSNHYLGIWFKKDKYKKAVWVANSENPVLDDSGVLAIRYDGNLVITDIRTIPIIVNYGNLSASRNTSAKIFDNGNLVLTEGETMFWQSFDYPSDTFLPGMKLGLFDLDTNNIRKQFLVSWLSPLVPTSGPFALGLDWYNRSAFDLWRRDGMFTQIGFFDGQNFRFFFQRASKSYNFTFVSTSREVYLTFDSDGNNISWFVLTSTGEINEFTMLDQGIAIVNHSLCEGKSVGSIGCVIPMPSMCGDTDEFSVVKGSMPNSVIVYDGSVRMGPSDCEIMCRNNCSCIAYTSFREDGTGCELYYGSKWDLLYGIGKGNGIIYVRGDVSKSSEAKRKRRLMLSVILPVSSLMVLIVASVWLFLRWRKFKNEVIRGREDALKESVSLLLYQFGGNALAVNDGSDANILELGKRKDPELPQISFSCIVTATDNFSSSSKIGEGGFGPVYKGKLLGHEIAVKRLSKMSGQGLEEFKNELQLISKLQHSNLVRLLGYCIEQEEKILIYEYMPNCSLHSFYLLLDITITRTVCVVADNTKRLQLDWGRRLLIIEGIAQGLLYLHKYSRFKIIHRDLKTSNILLDSYFNPKISDFGMARIFDENSEAKTKRVVGTYGYMSPEYALNGVFSTKSDIFSFGVIMLEIITGRKNTTFYQADRSLNLLGYAWEMWQEGHCLDLMDQTLADSCLEDELILCFQVALLCVQENMKDRPTMSDVVSMLSDERANLPIPKQPAFSTLCILNTEQPPSSNDLTFSEIEAR